MPGIPREKIDEVQAAADIVEVASDYVGRLKKSGSRYMALCPFHDEDTPSFSLSPDKNLYYCFGCLEEHEPVWTERGLVPIGQVQVGDGVLGLDGKVETITHKTVKEGPLLALEFGAVRHDPLLLTPDHTCVAVRRRDALRAVPMLGRRGCSIRFHGDRRAYRKTRPCAIQEIEAQNIRAGDYFLFPVTSKKERHNAPLPAPGPVVPSPEREGGEPVPAGATPVRTKGPAPTTFEALPVNEATARLYGLWLAEGSCYRGGVRWSFHRDETELADFVVETLAQHFGLDASRRPHASRHPRPGPGRLEVTCSNTPLSYLLPHWFGRGAKGKQLPFQALRWTQSMQRALLRGYFEGGGKYVGPRQWQAVCISRRLAQGLFALAIQARRSVSMGKNKRRTAAGNREWAVSLRKNESVEGFFHALDGHAYYWVKASRPRLLGEERTVVDLSVTGSHTFTTKIGAVHNCQAGGSIFTLVQEMEGVPFPEAVEQLADRFGVDLPQSSRGGGPERVKREPLHHALRFAARFFYHQLTTTEPGERALAYLTDERGLTEETIKAFGLGYAPGRWDALTTAAESEQIAPETLEEAGLAIARKGGDGYYDRYRGRVVFPLFSRVGRVLGFAGRVFEGAEGPAISGDFDPPKYINSPETPVYHKKDVLYGLHQAKNALRNEEEALLVEGYTDVIALHQAGVQHAVATCGTALTAEQAKMLGRYAERVTLLYDADEAGTRAALRGMDRVLEAGLGAYAARLPEGRDPDDFVREEGAGRFRRFLRKHRQGIAAFRRAQAERAGAFESPEDRTRTMRAVAESLALVPDEMARENQVRAASDALDMYEDLLRKAVEEARSEDQRKKKRRKRAPRPEAPADGKEPPDDELQQPEEETPAPLPQERNLLRLLLEHGRPMVELILGNMALTEFTDGPARELAGHFLQMYREGEVAPRRVLEGDFGPELQQLAAAVLTDEHEPSERWRDRDINVPRLNQEARKAAASSMRLLKLRRVDAELEKVKTAQFQSAPTEEDEREAQQQVMRLQQLRQQIQRGEFFDWDEGEETA